MERKYAIYEEKPELLEHRFERGFPMLYPMDTVKISSRWAGNGKNPDEGRIGYISKIKHSLQSLFNRDYLIVRMMGDEEFGNEHDFESWLYMLDLVEKDNVSGISESILKQFGCLLYLSDRIRVVNHPSFKGKVGTINSLSGVGAQGGWLGLVVTDEKIFREIKELYKGSTEKLKEDFEKMDTPERFSQECLRMLEANSEAYEDIVRQGKLKEIYEMILRKRIHKEHFSNPDFQRKLGGLQEKLDFSISSKDVELVERYPPNNLFK